MTTTRLSPPPAPGHDDPTSGISSPDYMKHGLT